jgi:hypothetical protein
MTPTRIKPPTSDKTSGHWKYRYSPADTNVAKQKLATTTNMLEATEVTLSASATNLTIAERRLRTGFFLTSSFPCRSQKSLELDDFNSAV